MMRSLLCLLAYLFLSAKAAENTTFAAFQGSTDTSYRRGLIDTIDLIPFDVQLGLNEQTAISIFKVADIVTSWLRDAVKEKLKERRYTEESNYAEFSNVYIKESSPNRRVLRQRELQSSTQQTGVLYTARFVGTALFKRDKENPLSIPANEFLDIQIEIFNDKNAAFDLRDRLREADEKLATQLAAVNAYLTKGGSTNQPNRPAGNNNNSTTNKQLQLVIIVAVCVAIVAFIFLIVAVVWAWQYDRRNRLAYLNDTGKQPKGTSDTADEEHAESSRKAEQKGLVPAPPLQSVYPNNAGPGNESVITDDISTSLSLYYRSGMATSGNANMYARDKTTAVNDAASVSSMESYGYSLDGYAPTISAPQPSDMPRLQQS